MRLADFVTMNPSEKLLKGTITKKISMDQLVPYQKFVSSFSKEPYSGGAKFRNGDTIMARITPCLENGKTAFVSILDEEEIGYGSTEYIVLRAKPNVSIPDFVYYLTISKIVREPAIKSMVGSSGRQRVQQSVLDELEIPSYSLAEQQHIVDILGTLDEKIEHLDKQIDYLEKHGALNYHNLFNNSKIMKERVYLKDIANFYNGYAYSGDELVETSKEGLATIKNFDRNGGFKLEGYKAINVLGKIKPTMYCSKGDLLVAHTDLTQNADIIGNPVLLLNHNNYKRIIFSMDLVKVTSHTLPNILLYYILKDKQFKAHALGYCSGTTVLHLNKKNLQEYSFDLPENKQLLQKLIEQLKYILERIESCFEERIKFIELKQLYLKKFFG